MVCQQPGACDNSTPRSLDLLAFALGQDVDLLGDLLGFPPGLGFRFCLCFRLGFDTGFGPGFLPGGLLGFLLDSLLDSLLDGLHVALFLGSLRLGSNFVPGSAAHSLVHTARNDGHYYESMTPDVGLAVCTRLKHLAGSIGCNNWNSLYLEPDSVGSIAHHIESLDWNNLYSKSDSVGSIAHIASLDCRMN